MPVTPLPPSWPPGGQQTGQLGAAPGLWEAAAALLLLAAHACQPGQGLALRTGAGWGPGAPCSLLAGKELKTQPL